MNKDINRREQIIFKQDYDKNSGEKFNQAYKEFNQKYLNTQISFASMALHPGKQRLSATPIIAKGLEKPVF